MKQFIKIESKGIIDTQAFILLGASSKRADNTKIGFFGSGLKYSIAYLLRNKIPFRAFAEYKEIKFTTVPTPFRDKSFDVICINGAQTSMTTEMGLDWEPWFVIREIYCNALDEGESSITVVDESECLPIEDKTVFYFEVTDSFKKIIAEWDYYFSENRGDLVFQDDKDNRIYSGGKGLIVYRKGIRCWFEPEEKSVFHYDMPWILINESRSIKSLWEFKWNLTDYLQKTTNEKIILQLLQMICDSYEATLDWKSLVPSYSETWLDCIGKRTLVPHENAGFWEEEVKASPRDYIILPNNLIEGLKSKFTDKVRIIGSFDGSDTINEFKVLTNLSKRQEFLMKEAEDFLKSAEYEIKYPMKVVRFIKANRLGQAKDGTILLSEKIFERGRKDLVATIVEEQEHLVTGYADETRAFQNHFINKFVSELENKTNTYL